MSVTAGAVARLPADPGMPIQEASRRLGVPAPTLRSWERRYGLSPGGRTAGGHRRYSEAVLVELGMIRDEIAVGRPPAAAARRVRLLLDERGTARPVVDTLLAASTEADPRALREVLVRAAQDLGVGAALDEVVLPSLRQIGSWWETGRCDIGAERLAVGVIRQWLAELRAQAPPAGLVSALLTVGPEDSHTVGVEALATLLALGGTGCVVLGPSTGVPALVDAAARHEPAVVVVVSHLASHRRGAVEALAAVAGHPGRTTFYAGNAFLLPRSRARVPGTYLGESITRAARLVRDSVDGAEPPPVPPPVLASAG